MKKHKYLFFALLLVLLWACSEDFVTRSNENGLDSESFLQTEAQARQAVTAVYDPLTHYGMYGLGFMVLGEAPTDNIQNDWGDGNWGPDIVSIHNFNWNSNNQYYARRWNSSYKAIARANFLLDNIDKVTEISQDLYDQYKGETLFLRALYYYNLVAGFGDIPLVTTTLTPSEINNIEKSPESEVWLQMESDLVAAASLLPTSYDAANVGRATRGAAFGLLSRVRLWLGDYPGAESAANSVDGLGYSLVSTDDFVKMFDGRMENSSESLFEAQLISGSGNVWNATTTNQSLLMHMLPRLPWGRYFYPRLKGDYNVVDEAFEAGDMRRESSILISGQDQVFYASIGETRVFPDVTVHTNFKPDIIPDGSLHSRKFIPYSDEFWGNGGGFNAQTSINIPIVRYAEVILNKAEALVEQNKLPEAETALNMIRARAGLSDVNGLSQGALREQIRRDRRVELFMEGHRWFDLKRWGTISEALTAANFTGYAGQVNWPIPAQEVDINPNLGN